MFPVKFQVRCEDEFHDVLYQPDGRLTFTAHKACELAQFEHIEELGGKVIGCADVLLVWRELMAYAGQLSNETANEKDLPKKLQPVHANLMGAPKRAHRIARQWQKLRLQRQKPAEIKELCNAAAEVKKPEFCRAVAKALIAEMNFRWPGQRFEMERQSSDSYVWTQDVAGVGVGWMLEFPPRQNLIAKGVVSKNRVPSQHMSMNSSQFYEYSFSRKNIEHGVENTADAFDRLVAHKRWLQYTNGKVNRQRLLAEENAARLNEALLFSRYVSVKAVDGEMRLEIQPRLRLPSVATGQLIVEKVKELDRLVHRLHKIHDLRETGQRAILHDKEKLKEALEGN